MTRNSPNRRQFLRTTAAAGAVLTAPNFLRARGAVDRLNIAMIGSGGRGRANLQNVGSENIVALCDVKQSAVETAAQNHPQAKKVTDFRRIYDKSNEIDAVVVSTCEHTHAFAVLPALQLGKHVYCEKPLTHNVWEARIIREAAAKAKVATQMGTQNHASDSFRRVVELIQTGAIGTVREAHVWVSRAWGLQSDEEAQKNQDRLFMETKVNVKDRPKEVVQPPADLDWDLWIGPAPYRPFHWAYHPGPRWYRWWDFGNGTMSDLGSHWNDLPFWALDLTAPTTIESFGIQPHPEIAPATMKTVYEFPANGKRPPVRLTWYQGTVKPPQYTEGKLPRGWDNGVLFVGEKGMLLGDSRRHVLLPEKDFENFQRPAPFIPKSLGHWAEWIHACKTGAPTTCNFEYAGKLTESNHLGNVAYRAGKKLQWDTKALKATNCPEADAFIRREYRSPWKLV